ncbi:MAG: hypothetical protein ACI9YB_002003, partial [Halioglobus sp.]
MLCGILGLVTLLRTLGLIDQICSKIAEEWASMFNLIKYFSFFSYLLTDLSDSVAQWLSGYLCNNAIGKCKEEGESTKKTVEL